MDTPIYRNPQFGTANMTGFFRDFSKESAKPRFNYKACSSKEPQALRLLICTMYNRTNICIKIHINCVILCVILSIFIMCESLWNLWIYDWCTVDSNLKTVVFKNAETRCNTTRAAGYFFLRPPAKSWEFQPQGHGEVGFWKISPKRKWWKNSGSMNSTFNGLEWIGVEHLYRTYFFWLLTFKHRVVFPLGDEDVHQS